MADNRQSHAGGFGALIAVCLTALSSGTGRADDAEIFARFCNGPDTSPGRRVAACGELLASPGLRPAMASVAYNNRGSGHLQNGDLDKAMADFNKAISLNPDHAHAYFNRGSTRIQMRRMEQAIADFDTAIRLKPDFAAAFNNRGIARRHAGRIEDAIKDYDQAIRLNPADSRAPHNRDLAIVARSSQAAPAKPKGAGTAAKATAGPAPVPKVAAATPESDGKAIASTSKARPDAPKRPKAAGTNEAQAYFNRGTVHVSKGEFDLAVASYDEAIRLNPEYAFAYYNRGMAQFHNGNNEHAIADYTDAIRLRPQYANAYHARANAYYRMGLFAEAGDDYEATIRIRPDNVEAYNNFAWLLATAPSPSDRDGGRAVTLARHAVSLRRSPFHLGTLAASFARVGLFVEAVAMQQQAIAMMQSEQDDPQLLQEFQSRLKLYRQGKPYETASQ